ncbi:phage tail tip protein J-related protein [Providencia huaxiensis]|uniref:phage tail tip protein J-related protein n=2 Tax=Gammaproteobacteria TaxID=1236 RepID=UPI0034E6001B
MGKVVSNIVSTGLMIAGAMMGGPAGWAMIAAGMATQFAGSRLFKDKMPSMGYRDQSERKQMLRSSTAPETIIVGKTVCSGLLFFAEEEKGDQTENERLFMALAIAAHKVDHIGQIWLNDDLIGTFGDKASYEFHNGRTDCDPYLLKNAPSWKSDMIGDGLAWLRLTLKYDAEKFPYGVPNVKAEIWGKPVYDPRTGKTGWSNNGALIILDYYRSYLDVPDSDIDFDAFKVAADLCDEPVTTPEGKTEPRYTINGAYELSEGPSSTLDHMHKCIAAEPTYIAGKHGILMQAYNGPAVLRIEPNQIVDTVNITPDLPLRDATNAIYGTFVDAEQQYIKTDFTPVIVDEWIEEDGLEIKENMDYRFVTSPYQASRLANLYLRKKRAGRKIQLSMNMDGYAYRPGDVALLNLPHIGIQNFECRVAEWKFHPQEGVDILLEEDGAYIYEDIIGKPFVRPPFTVLPTGGVAPPLNLAFVATNIGEVVQGYLSWQSAAADVRYNTVNIIENGKVIQSIQVPQDRVDLSGLVRGSYRAEVRSINAAGAMSAPAIVDFDIQAPPKPVSVEMVGGMFSLTCIPHGGETAQHGYTFEFWFSDKKLDSTNDTEVTTKANRQGQGQFWTKENLKAGTDYWFYVRTVNSYGKSPFVEAVGQASGTPKDMIDELGNNFLTTEAGQQMQEQIDFNKDHIEDLTLEQLEIKHDIVNVDSKTIDLNNKVVQLNTDVEIVNEAVLQNTQFTTQVSFKLSEEVADRKAEIFRLEQVRVTDLDALARWQEQISVKVGSNTSSILEVKEAQATYEAASAKQISQVKADVDSVTGRVTQVETATATLTEAQAKFERSTIAQFEEHQAYITNIETSLSNAEMTMSEALMQTTAQFNSLHDKQLKSEAKITKNEKAIATETEVRATMGVQLEARIDNNESGITEIKETVAEQGKTIASTTEQLRAEIKTGDDKLQEGIDNQGRELSKISSSVDEQKTAIAELDKTQTELKQTQQSNYEENNAHIANLQQTIANSDSANAEAIMQTTAQTTLNHNENLKVKASVERQQKAIANQQEAHAELSEKVDAQYADNQATFVDIRKSQADDKKAASEHTEQVRAELGKDIADNKNELSNINAVVTEHSKSIATLEETTTEIQQSQKSQHEDTQASIDELKQTTASTDKALTQAKEEANSHFEDNDASIANIQNTHADAESSLAEMAMQLSAQQNVQGTELLRAKASITRIDKVVADNNHAFAQSIEKLETQFDDVNASITTLKKTVSDGEKAQAETNQLLMSEIGDNKSAIELRGQTVFDHKGNGSAIYTIKTGINWNGQYYDAKFMMGATVKNGKVVTQIGFSADTFGIFNPSIGKLEPVFFVENGQVFINEAFINKAVIGSIVVQTDMRSKNYKAGKEGSRIDMENSVFEFNGKNGEYSTIMNNQGFYVKKGDVYIIELGVFK